MSLPICSEHCWLNHLTLTLDSECSESKLVSQRKFVITQSNCGAFFVTITFQQFVTQDLVPTECFRLTAHCLVNW